MTFVSRGPGKACYSTQARPARKRAPVFSDFTGKTETVLHPCLQANSIVAISGFCTFLRVCAVRPGAGAPAIGESASQGGHALL